MTYYQFVLDEILEQEAREEEGQRPVVQPRENVTGEEVGFGGVRIAGEDEGLDTQRAIGVQLGQHLVGIADDRGAP